MAKNDVPAPVMQKDVEGPFWTVSIKAIVREQIRSFQLVVRAHDFQEAMDKGLCLAEAKGFQGVRCISAKLY